MKVSVCSTITYHYDVEFLDPSGGYHHWKSEFDGGCIIPNNGEE